ncbi:MAG: CHRD domain-containing protein [Candidatus Binatia bacterium]
MKAFGENILMLIVFLALCGVASAKDKDGLKFDAQLTGAQEVPERDTPAKADIAAQFDLGFTELEVELKVSDNTVGTVTRAHFHCAAPGANGPIVFGLFDPGPFPVGNRVDGTLTNADYTGADCVPTTGRVINNLASLALAMRDGLIYANIHTTIFTGGELRGQMIEVEGKDRRR